MHEYLSPAVLANLDCLAISVQPGACVRAGFAPPNAEAEEAFVKARIKVPPPTAASGQSQLSSQELEPGLVLREEAGKADADRRLVWARTGFQSLFPDWILELYAWASNGIDSERAGQCQAGLLDAVLKRAIWKPCYRMQFRDWSCVFFFLPAGSGEHAW